MQRILIYLLRRDLRLADNPVFTQISRLNSQSQKPFTHLLPVYVLPANQIEISGLASAGQKSPYPEARSSVAGFWRCGKLRAKFTAESIWDLKTDLEQISSGLVIRAGTAKDVVQSFLSGYRDNDEAEVHGIWMTSEEGWEEKVEEADVRRLAAEENVEFSLRNDEKYFVDDRDLPFKDVVRDLSDVFTTYRKQVEPLRSAPRREFPAPKSLPPLPDFVPEQAAPFAIPDTLDSLVAALHKPLDDGKQIADLPDLPEGAKSAHPFKGGSKAGQDRISHLIESGSMTAYKDTRNGLLGLDFSTKLSAWLALGCISARQVHWRLIEFEDGKTELGNKAEGYGKGESKVCFYCDDKLNAADLVALVKGSAAVRFELLWRDYMRLCTKKFGSRLFLIDGYRQDHNVKNSWKSSPYTTSTNKKNKGGVNDNDTRIALERFLTGHTGTGLIDASQRELWLTGWTSNRARQNVASYLAKRLWIDWRIGAEWYEMNLVDHDVSSNWGNW